MKLKFEQPLRHRPGVLVHRKPDGKSVVIGDGCPFTPAEMAAISPVIEQPKHDPGLTAEERAELDQAEARLAEALRLVELAAEAMFETRDKGRAYERNLGRVSASEAKRIKELKTAHDAAQTTWQEAREAEGLARREQTNVSLRVHQAARFRELAAERAAMPPPPTLTERMAGLAGRLA